ARSRLLAKIVSVLAASRSRIFSATARSAGSSAASGSGAAACSLATAGSVAGVGTAASLGGGAGSLVAAGGVLRAAAASRPPAAARLWGGGAARGGVWGRGRAAPPGAAPPLLHFAWAGPGPRGARPPLAPWRRRQWAPQESTREPCSPKCALNGGRSFGQSPKNFRGTRVTCEAHVQIKRAVRVRT